MTYEFETTEEEYMELEVPDCYSYYDPADMNCRRCPIIDYCKAEQSSVRASCYGLFYDESNDECSRCLDESPCVEKYNKLQGDDQVTKKVRVRRRRPQPKIEEVVTEEELEEEETAPVKAKAAPKKATTRKRTTRKKAAPKPPPEPEPEEEELDDDDDYGSWGIVDLRAELKDRELDSTGRKSVLVDRLMADDAGELEEEEEPEPAPKKKVVRRGRKKAVQPEPEEEEEEEEVTEQADVTGTFNDFFTAMPKGAVVSVARLDEDTWQFTFGGEVAAVTAAKGRGRGLSGKAFEKEAYAPEYFSWYYEDSGDGKPWGEMSADERYAFAEECDAEWAEHENPKTDAMRMGQAVREALGIEKWKPEYKSRAARKALKDQGICAV